MLRYIEVSEQIHSPSGYAYVIVSLWDGVGPIPRISQRISWFCFVQGKYVSLSYSFQTGTTVAQWLRRCATNRKVAGSIPAGVSGFLINISPSDRTMALGPTQPLTEMSTRSIS